GNSHHMTLILNAPSPENVKLDKLHYRRETFQIRGRAPINMTKVSIIAVQRLSLRDAEDFIVDRMKSSNAPLYMDDHRAMVHESLVHDLEDREGPLHLSAYESSILSGEVNEYLLADKAAREITQVTI